MPDLIILPRDLDPAADVFPSDALVVDSGRMVAKATPQQVVDAGRPWATVQEAEAGTAADRAMSPLSTAAAVQAQVAGAISNATAGVRPYGSYALALAAAPNAPADALSINAIVGGKEVVWVRSSSGVMLGGGWTSATQRASLLHFGIVGSGSNEKARLDAAIASGLPLEGRGMVVSVTGQVDIPSNADIEDVSLRQLAPGSSLTMRTLNVVNRSNVRLARVKVDRNGDGTNGGLLAGSGVNGALATAFGIFIDNCTGCTFEDLEVWGDDSGTGILFRRLNSTNQIIRPYAHDIRWVRATGTDDMVQGVWFDVCSGMTVVQPRAERMTGVLAGSASRRFTRGISMGGCSGVTLDRAFSVTTDQGIDITGGPNMNQDVRVLAPYVRDAWVWGIKLANTARRVKIIDGLAEDCGVGYVASGQGDHPLDVSTQDSGFYNCTALNTGSNGQTVVGIAGFRVMNNPGSATDLNAARNIVFDNCLAIDTQATKTMGYGFASNAPSSSAPFADNCRSIGHITAAYTGTWKSFNGVGAVAQADGTLSARFQIGGSDATGWFEIREDGYMEVHATLNISAQAISTPAGSLFATSEPFYFAFPAAFMVGLPTISANFERGGNSLATGVTISGVSQGSCTLTAWADRQIPAVAEKRIHLIAKGRRW